MVSVFIGFGGAKAEEVARKLEIFLRSDTRLETFLASPESSALALTVNFKLEIEKNLLDCNVAVFVCHENTSRSIPMKKEIDLLFSKNFENKIISFAVSDTCIPKKLRENKWHPLHFPPEKPEESFCRLLNWIYRCYIELKELTTVTTEGAEMVRQ